MAAINSIGFIGSGNVAKYLSRRLHRSGFDVTVVADRHGNKPEPLFPGWSGAYSNDLEVIREQHPDLVLVAVGDDAITDVAAALSGSGIPLAHTSGAVPIGVLAEVSADHGCIYPVQTLSCASLERAPVVPLCVHGSNEHFLKRLEALAHAVSSRVNCMDDTQRAWLHLCAAMLNNNIHHLVVKCRDLMDRRDLPFDLLEPLLKETIAAAVAAKPREGQTGPARRGDDGTGEKHLALLQEAGEPHMMRLYQAFWDSITAYFADGQDASAVAKAPMNEEYEQGKGGN